jgi:DNA-binding MarR family transcriptional regulator
METQWLSSEEQATWRAFVVSTMLVNAALDRQLLQESDLPVTYYAILVALSEAPDQRMRMGELAESLCVSQSRMTHAVTSLERRNLVQRESCTDDGRGQNAVLTAAGRAALSAAAPGHVHEVRRRIFDQLTDAQVRQLREVCEALLSGFNRSDAWPWARIEMAAHED